MFGKNEIQQIKGAAIYRSKTQFRENETVETCDLLSFRTILHVFNQAQKRSFDWVHDRIFTHLRNFSSMTIFFFVCISFTDATKWRMHRKQCGEKNEFKTHSHTKRFNIDRKEKFTCTPPKIKWAWFLRTFISSFEKKKFLWIRTIFDWSSKCLSFINKYQIWIFVRKISIQTEEKKNCMIHCFCIGIFFIYFFSLWAINYYRCIIVYCLNNKCESKWNEKYWKWKHGL